jgi:endonuclease/exonuclease/phosphatase family metal-dependent hydrolase
MLIKPMELIHTRVDSLPAISRKLRARIDADNGSAQTHAERMMQIEALHCVETGPPATASLPLTAPAKIVSWNIERGYRVADVVEHIGATDPDVVLLCEVDLGMARTGQRHIAREIAEPLEMGYAFAVEFAELGLGSARERELFKGCVNDVGFHGAAILSREPIMRPALLRLEASGDWYSKQSDERRIGGRMALIATINISGINVTFATTHVENLSTPHERANQMAILLDATDIYSQGSPVLIGGDFNTNTAARFRADWQTYQVQQERDNPGFFANPVAHEPMFEMAKSKGYDWRQCNAKGTTTRLHPWQSPDKPMSKLDWFFAKGLDTTNPAIIASFDRKSGRVLSDHDLLEVHIALLAANTPAC